MRRIKFIALKELYHILRDPRSLTIVIVMPIMMTFLYGYATNLDIKKVVISVIDQDQSVESHSLQDAFYQSTYFERPTREVDLLDPECCGSKLCQCDCQQVYGRPAATRRQTARRRDSEAGPV